MKVILSESQINRFVLRKMLRSNKIFSQPEIANMGGGYQIEYAYLMDVPINSIVGLDPESSDWTADSGDVRKFEKSDTIDKPIAVQYDEGEFLLLDGNHRLKQAKVNQQESIMAFVKVTNELKKILAP